ncbi:hypothetical protein [Acaryochloris sp. 'Moss Beach']|uniref:hypothetical protein n=1 Tax=Acaryochloris sp. 'Moss Beach' TaxID=2740837 RepID=UPI001F47C00E|nr:hypothetical protein [Acaryochloris sp. 'Moss Beach']
MRKPFATPGFCWECAVELEKNFAILQVMAEGRPEVIETEVAEDDGADWGDDRSVPGSGAGGSGQGVIR